jgi:hypothetical protein
MATVFVQVPSYRDFELPATLRSLEEASSGKHQISIGVHQCLMFRDEVVVPEPRYDHVTINRTVSIAPVDLGEFRSRGIANQFYDGEDFYFQIDSHSRVTANWDDLLIQNIAYYQSMGIEKPLVTMYPHDYGYDDAGEEVRHPSEFSLTAPFRPTIILMRNPQRFKKEMLLDQTAMACHLLCGYTASVSNGFIFTLGEIASVKPNPKIAFWGSELIMAARAFTHGFDLVTPLQGTMWHLYNSGQKFYKTRRHAAWGDFPEAWRTIDTQSKKEVARILTDAVVGEYELGSQRTLAEYGEFAGLDFTNREITQADYSVYCRP